jgi:hypothetical protein
VESAVKNLYDEKESGSSFLIATNPRHTQPFTIGRLCYKGLANSDGSAYKLFINEYQQNTDGELYFVLLFYCKFIQMHVKSH